MTGSVTTFLGAYGSEPGVPFPAVPLVAVAVPFPAVPFPAVPFPAVPFPTVPLVATDPLEFAPDPDAIPVPFPPFEPTELPGFGGGSSTSGRISLIISSRIIILVPLSITHSSICLYIVGRLCTLGDLITSIVVELLELIQGSQSMGHASMPFSH